MGHHKRCRVKRFGFFFSPLVLVFSRWPGPGDLGGSQVGRPVVENGFLTMAFRRHRLVHDGLSPILCQLKGTTCYNMLHYILHKHRGEVMLNPPRYLPWASMLYSKINRVSKHPMVYDHLPQTMKHEPARIRRCFPKWGTLKSSKLGYVLTLTHIDTHEEHGGPPRRQKSRFYIHSKWFKRGKNCLGNRISLVVWIPGCLDK